MKAQRPSLPGWSRGPVQVPRHRRNPLQGMVKCRRCCAVIAFKDYNLSAPWVSVQWRKHLSFQWGVYTSFHTKEERESRTVTAIHIREFTRRRSRPSFLGENSIGASHMGAAGSIVFSLNIELLSATENSVAVGPAWCGAAWTGYTPLLLTSVQYLKPFMRLWCSSNMLLIFVSSSKKPDRDCRDLGDNCTFSRQSSLIVFLFFFLTASCSTNGLNHSQISHCCTTLMEL